MGKRLNIKSTVLRCRQNKQSLLTVNHVSCSANPPFNCFSNVLNLAQLYVVGKEEGEKKKIVKCFSEGEG